MAGVKELYEFLEEAELGQYYSAFQNQLKVTTVPQLKYVEETDMAELGMTRPEMRRLKKFFRKECPQGALGKIKKILTKPGLDVPHQGSPPNDRSPTHVKGASKHIIPQDAITVCTTLGTGEFGTVQQGIWTNEEGDRVQVAIKCLSKEKMQTGIADFLKEATIMHSLDHPHIVQLYGVVLDSQSYMLVTELAPLRSLLECLKEARLRSSFSVQVLCEFAIQIVEGMAYLESKRLIHRDLAARNVLVFAKDKVKISDFGLSRALGVGKDYYQTNFNVNLKLPIAWCAPECIHYLKFTSSSDVWAFGVTLWEMFSYGFQPWAAFTGQQILDAIDEPNCQRLECPESCPRQYYDLMLKCWDIDDKKRPTFSEISRILPQIKPEQVQAMEDSGNQNNEFLVYNKQDLITVLDKRPSDPPAPGLWKGVTDNGKTGWFLSVNVAPYIELKAASSPMLRKVKINRKESGRKSMKGGKKLHAGLISRPQNDLRHTGHIGYDGAMFGDVAFIGDNYDKLPVKVVTPYKPHEDLESSMTSSIPPPDDVDKPDPFNSSVTSLTSDSANLMSTSIISDTSYTSMASSQDTLTDVSSFHGDTDSLVPVKNGRASPAKYEDVDETDLDNFRLPDISSSLSLDFGPSFMDEVMKALNDSGDSKKSVEDVSADSALLTDTSPLLERDAAPPRFSSPHSAAAFDNVAMAAASDIDSNESHSRTISSTELDHQAGDLDSSFSSAKDTPDSRKSEDQDEEDSQKNFKPKLKLMIPSHNKKIETKKQAKVKPMSAADEKKIDEAIAMANEFALHSRADRSPSPALLEEPDASPSLRNMFGLKKKEKSPKPEKKTYTEEIANVSDLNEDVTPEAQEAYNMLVVRGSVRDRSGERSPRERSADRGERSKARERRMRRSLEHQRQSITPERPVSTGVIKNGRHMNQNIRSPQGIPGRRPAPQITPDDDGSGDGAEMDTNPLRRLRESQRAFTRPRPPAALPVDDEINGHGPRNHNNNKLENIRHPNLITPNQAHRLSRESDSDRSSPPPTEPRPATSSSDDLSTNLNPIPLPPRRPMRPSTIGVAPKGRKYPLDLSKDDEEKHSSSSLSSVGEKRSGYSDDLPPQPPSPPPQNHHDTTQDSEDSVFSESSAGILDGINSEKRFSLSMFTSSSVYSVKGVKCSAAEMGINNNSDSFWQKEVDLDDLQATSGDLEDDLVDDISPMIGRYKTSDNVSYEDLLDFALDGPENVGSVDQGRDEIRLMRRVLTKQVTVEDCLMALEETNWDVHNAIKYVKLKQLLATQLGGLDSCKEALLQCWWNVQEAANYMLANPADQESPECVDV